MSAPPNAWRMRAILFITNAFCVWEKQVENFQHTNWKLLGVIFKGMGTQAAWHHDIIIVKL